MIHSDNLFPEYPLAWEMSIAERFVFVGLLSRLRPEVAVEIGTHHGGSLQVLDSFCGTVHSIDIDPTVRERLEGRFPRVKFHTGPSSERIPEVLSEIDAAGGKLEFVLVDGDHSADGVRSDIETLLCYRPSGRMYILLHDSFNPDCRAGMGRAAWEACPHVHAVDLDFAPGAFLEAAQGSAFARSMWGGFALAVLQSEPRLGPLSLKRSQEALHRMAFRRSAHRIWHKALRALRRAAAR